MHTVNAFPPGYEAIAATFDLRGIKPIFAWGDKIFNPHGIAIGPELLAHERVHGDRQKLNAAGAAGWWQRYLADPKFRLEEELLAHRAEYRAYCANGNFTRNQRRIVLRHIAQRLASRLYGSMIALHDAKVAIAAP